MLHTARQKWLAQGDPENPHHGGRAEFGFRAVWQLLLALALVVAATAFLLAVTRVFELNHVSIAYLVPVLISAVRWGVLPGILSALAGAAASAFFFYPPIYSLRVSDPQQVVDLALFLVVVAVTSHLAANVRRRENELSALYEFSRRLAAAQGPSDIYAAIQLHLNAVLNRRVILFEAASQITPAASPHGDERVPTVVREAVADAIRPDGAGNDVTIRDQTTGCDWLIRPVARNTPSFGIVAVELGRASGRARRLIQRSVDSVLADSAATLDRLDVAGALGDARMRTETETFRDALIGSVSHELRTPLTSVVGSTYVIANALSRQQEPGLAALADDLRYEAERLNDDIQNLLDASRITGAGVRPQLQWADAADIVNAAVERQQRRLAGHRIEFDLADELPLAHTDPVLVEQALGQVLANAAKYSPIGSTITVATFERDGEIAVGVADCGCGLTDEERTRMWERFYRGPRHHATAAGSGLGLWIARAFVVATGGRIEATSRGDGDGTTMTIVLPAPHPPAADDLGSADE